MRNEVKGRPTLNGECGPENLQPRSEDRGDAEIDGGRRIGEVARHLEVSPHLLERWRGEWQARGELAFPGIGRRGVSPALTELQRIAELERKIGQLTMENDFLKKALEHFRTRQTHQLLAKRRIVIRPRFVSIAAAIQCAWPFRCAF